MRVTIDSWTGPATQTDPAPTTIPPSDRRSRPPESASRPGQCLGRSERSCALRTQTRSNRIRSRCACIRVAERDGPSAGSDRLHDGQPFGVDEDEISRSGVRDPHAVAVDGKRAWRAPEADRPEHLALRSIDEGQSADVGMQHPHCIASHGDPCGPVCHANRVDDPIACRIDECDRARSAITPCGADLPSATAAVPMPTARASARSATRTTSRLRRLIRGPLVASATSCSARGALGRSS